MKGKGGRKDGVGQVKDPEIIRTWERERKGALPLGWGNSSYVDEGQHCTRLERDFHLTNPTFGTSDSNSTGETLYVYQNAKTENIETRSNFVFRQNDNTKANSCEKGNENGVFRVLRVVEVLA